MSGQLLRRDLVREARSKELRYFCGKCVCIKRVKGEAGHRNCKCAVSVRLVDLNKVGDPCLRNRSRLVARQLHALGKSGDIFFALALPLGALRTVLSLAMTKVGDRIPERDPTSRTRAQVRLVDI